jgi:hypothetical protein
MKKHRRFGRGKPHKNTKKGSTMKRQNTNKSFDNEQNTHKHTKG